MINPYGVAMLCDFGCARTQVATHSIAKPSEAIKGTCNYWAPELLRRQNDVLSAHTMETDVWAFGMTIYVRLNLALSIKVLELMFVYRRFLPRMYHSNCTLILECL